MIPDVLDVLLLSSGSAGLASLYPSDGFMVHHDFKIFPVKPPFYLSMDESSHKSLGSGIARAHREVRIEGRRVSNTA